MYNGKKQNERNVEKKREIRRDTLNEISKKKNHRDGSVQKKVPFKDG